MKPVNEPLSEAELVHLNEFLVNRIDDTFEYQDQDRDFGIIDIASLDGFFTAIVSGPVAILPSRWLPSLWGDFDINWESQQESEEILGLLVRHMNDIAECLTYQPEYYEPIFYEREYQGKTALVVDEWCDGYCRGMLLAEDKWMEGGEQMKIWLTPMIAFSELTGWAGHEFDHDQVEILQESIAPNVRSIHAYWLAQRGQDVDRSSPVKRAEPQPGRNDPCPCGSGRKYKLCCLH